MKADHVVKSGRTVIEQGNREIPLSHASGVVLARAHVELRRRIEPA